jgi:pyruvate/2-oxoglutarate dehydrogenase complex dihydrolipoamide acyltransferase (E2) component
MPKQEIKIRSFVWKEKFETFDGKTRVRNRMASRGEVVELDEATTKFGESMGAFVTDEDREEAASEDVLDLAETVEEMGDDELMNWVSDATIPQIMNVTKADTSLISRILDAENKATGNDPRAGLVEGLARLAGSGEQQPDPDEAGGVVEVDDGDGGTVSVTQEAKELADKFDIEVADVDGTGEDDVITEPDIKEFYNDEMADATDAAVDLADEKGVFLGEVKGTGKDGRIEKPDVQEFLDKQGEDED